MNFEQHITKMDPLEAARESTRQMLRGRRSAPVDLAVDALAAYRATRLVVTDELFERPRDAVTSWLERRGHDKLMTLLACPFCVGVYASAAVLLLRRRGGRGGALLRDLLAVAGAQALASSVDMALNE